MNGNGKESSKRRRRGDWQIVPTNINNNNKTNAILIKICTHIEQKETETTRPKRFPSLPPHKPAPAQGQPRDTAATDVAPSPAPFPCHCPSVGVEIEKTKTNLSMKHFFHSFSAAGSKIKWKLFFIYEKNVRHDTPCCHTRLPYGLGNCVGQHLKWSQRAREPTNHLQFAIRIYICI